MKFDIKDMYRYLISHTFPGLLFGIEVILTLYWFTDIPVGLYVNKALNLHPSTLIVIGYASSTLFGHIVDGIHHFVFEDIFDTKLFNLIKLKCTKYRICVIIKNFVGYIYPEKYQSKCSKEKFMALGPENKLELYSHFIEDDYYYPYESYANTCIVLFIGLILLISLFFFGKSNHVILSESVLNLLKVAIPIFMAISFIMAYVAKTTSWECDDEEEQFNSAYLSADEKGITPHEGVYTRLRPSKIHGIGVFAIREIKEGTCIFSGDDNPLVWIDKPDLDSLPQEISQLYKDFAIIKDNDTLYGCPKNFNMLTVGWYLNHSEEPNVGCNIEDEYNFYALRDIKPDDELTVDYRTYSELPYPT